LTEFVPFIFIISQYCPTVKRILPDRLCFPNKLGGLPPPSPPRPVRPWLHNLEHFKQHEKPRNDHAVQAAILTLRAQCHYSVIQLWACVLFVSQNRFQNLFYKLVWLVHDHGLRKCRI
jgi:hypothetical protein